ncbi:MAG TPA: NAD-dependent epimerase/dehydratase family protein [Candidatus Udaeobacter sp.]|nr:NAD-dependent epimerase/dehydratase family protein [Candidatus Udaeobacter sp.]
MSDQSLFKKSESCRVCKGKNLTQVLSLGSTPPANAFLKPEDLEKPEHSFPLELSFCKDCSFVGLSHVVSPDLLFSNYVYSSSTSPVFVAHFKAFASEMAQRFSLNSNSLVVDIGSNDGILLRPYKEMGVKIMGVDPAANIAARATENGIETMAAYFTPEIANKIVQAKGKASLVTATSVFPHIDDLDQVVEGVKNLLADDGVFVIEAYYLLDLVEKNLFDTIYHEHLSYFTVKTISTLFDRLGMQVFDVDKTDTHGGSLRVFVQRKGGKYPLGSNVERFINEEKNKKINEIETFTSFEAKIAENKTRLLGLLSELKSKGKKIVGYGAPAKGSTLLNYFNIGTETLDYIIDDSVWKQGLYTPGTHIPVKPATELKANPPDYILVLAWNFADSIIKKCSDFENFIIPVPFAQVVSGIVEGDLDFIAKEVAEVAKSLEGKSVLITGGSGFIGSYFIAVIDLLNKRYFKEPCRVLSIDNHIIGKKNNLLKEIDSNYISFKNHNICDPLTLDVPVDYIISAAGIASPVYYMRYPIETIEGAVFGLSNMLKLGLEKKVKSILYFSSSEIYGDPDPKFIPTPETYRGNVSSTGPRSCYDESKRLGETLGTAYHRVHNTPIKIVRPFNVYGPGMSAKDYRVVPTFLSQAIEGKPLSVHGKGNQTRTFCYASDAMVGFFKVLLSEKNGEVFNIGNDDEEINMKALAEIVSEIVTDKKVEINLVNYPDTYPQDEPSRRCPDLSKAKSQVDFHPSINLRAGLSRSYKWMKNILV